VRTHGGQSGELILAEGRAAESVLFDRILVAAGRAPRTAGLGLDAVGVQIDARGAVVVDRHLRTPARGVFAVGDLTGLLPFTHVAAHHARVATSNALCHTRLAVSDTLPWVTFTDPEVGRVGLTEAEARERWGGEVVSAELDYASLERAITAVRHTGSRSSSAIPAAVWWVRRWPRLRVGRRSLSSPPECRGARRSPPYRARCTRTPRSPRVLPAPRTTT